jgi:hypothetical protein
VYNKPNSENSSANFSAFTFIPVTFLITAGVFLVSHPDPNNSTAAVASQLAQSTNKFKPSRLWVSAEVTVSSMLKKCTEFISGN